jgi:radical SAM superfamily enzyme YgiQ (UPF0313 family)
MIKLLEYIKEVIIMKTLLIGINSKYIHPNLAIRYLKANSRFLVETKEYTIKDDLNNIIKDILDFNPTILGFSCYIWNIKIIIAIIEKIRIQNPKIKIILGGPEISFDYDDFLINNLADYIIVNEGEIAFEKLQMYLSGKIKITDVENLAYIERGKIVRNNLKLIPDLNLLNNPYHFESDFESIKNKIQYLELSRGCPYNCSYCLASLETGLRFFDLDKTFENIDHLVKKGAKTIKFLDRSFNAHKNLALDFFKKLIKKDYPDTIFQFEINGDVLSEEIVNYLILNCKKNYLRFELGVQSTNHQVNKAIDRYQDTDRLISTILKLKSSNVILHLDLIAGLPYEDLNSFKKTFNDIFSLFPNELQLGFLKMLKGTKIRRESSKYGYLYQTDPPYEIISNDFINSDEIKLIHLVEQFLDIYWNKNFMNQSIIHISKCFDNYFDFFLELGNYYQKNNLSTKRYQLADLFVNLIGFLNSKNLFDEEIYSILKLDYLLYHSIKPKSFWKKLDNKNDLIRIFSHNNPDFNIDVLYKYSVVTTYKKAYVLALYLPEENMYFIFDKTQTKRIG